jgi:L-amino acid N-acyltransferase YncA
MTIRFAKQEDLHQIVAIYNQAISAGQRTGDTEPVSPESRTQWFESHSAEKYPIIVKQKDASVIAYLTFSAHRPGRAALRHTAEVSFYVDFDHHRKGVASALLNYAIDLCPSLEIKTLFAVLMETNTASIECFKSFGFELWGHLPQVADYDGIEVGQLYYGRRIEH